MGDTPRTAALGRLTREVPGSRQPAPSAPDPVDAFLRALGEATKERTLQDMSLGSR